MRIGASALVMISILACGSGDPTSREASMAVQEEMSEWLDGAVELKDLQKTDGQAMEMFGVKGYTLDFSGVGKVKKDVYAQSAMTVNGIRMWVTMEPETARMIRRAPLLRAGQEVELFGNVSFEKKESGWVATSVDLDFRDAEQPS